MAIADQLLIKVNADVSQAQASMYALDRTVGATSKSMMAKMAGVGAAIGKAFFVAGAAAAIGGIKAFTNFESEMTKSMAIMGDEAGEWREKMESAAREVGKTTLFSATEAAEAYFFLASAGMSAEQQISAMPQVAKFAQAGMFDLALATDLATDAQSALGLTVKDPIKNLENLTRVTDVFVKANTLANTSVEQIATAMTTKAAAAGRKFGMGIEEVAAVLLVMADAGVKGATAGTQFSMMLNNITGNAVKNSSAFEAVGIAVFDASGNMRNMSDIVKDMTGAFAGMSDEQAVAAMGALGFGDKAKGVLAVLQGSSEAMAGYEEALRSATGFADTVAAKQLLSFESQLILLKSQFVDIGLTIGSVLVPILLSLVEVIAPIIAKIATWAEANDKLATNIVLVSAAVYPLFKLVKFLNPWVTALFVVIGLVAVAMDYFGISVDDVVEALKPIITYFRLAWETGSQMNMLLRDLPAPIKDIIEALGSLVSAGGKHWDNIKLITKDAAEALVEYMTPIAETVGRWAVANAKLATSIGLVIAAIVPIVKIVRLMNPWFVAIAVIIWAIKEAMDYFGISIGDLIGWFTALVDYFKFTVSSGDSLNDFLMDLPESIRGIVEAIGEWVVQGKAMFETIVAYIRDHTDEMMAMFNTVKDAITEAWEIVWTVLEPIVTLIVNFLRDEIGGVISWLVEILPMIWTVIKHVLTTAWKIWKRIWGILAKYLEPLFVGILKIISGALRFIKGIISSAMKFITGDWSGAWDALVDALLGVWDAILGVVETAMVLLDVLFATMAAALISAWDILWVIIGDSVKAAWEGIKGWVTDGVNSILDSIAGMVNGAIGLLNKLIETINLVPGVSIPTISNVAFSIPALANGGTITNAGSVLVGERGAEVLNLPAGASVTPLNGAQGAANVTVYIGEKEFSDFVLDNSSLSAELSRLSRSAG